MKETIRAAAIEVLTPVMRKATTTAAKYAVTKGPGLVQDKVAPKLEDAGGLSGVARALRGVASGIRDRLPGSRRALTSDLMRFKGFIELRDEATGDWRGRIEDGDVVDQEGDAEELDEPEVAEEEVDEPEGAEEDDEEPALPQPHRRAARRAGKRRAAAAPARGGR